MTASDYLIILLYFIGLLVLGATLGRKIQSSKEMFIAGRNASWWLSGLSTYMTIFSAGTFVVWGGVAYRSGLVAVVVALMLGVASLLVGRLLAGRWSRLRIDSPAEYLGVRFGQPTVRFYTLVLIVGRGISTAVALYAIAIMVVALMPLPEGHLLADPATGHLSVTWAVLIMGAITFVYTAAGGFIAVLMTDVIQFAVLMAMILIMVPLSFGAVGGVGEFAARAPEGFFSVVSDRYSWGWMILWCLLNAFMIGGDWPFVQRYISVPTPKEARKSIYLVGALYLTTPFLWYIPTLAYRILNADANPEQAYMLMSRHVLGAGMVGLMLAAMISATLSMVSGTLNVFANVFTCDIYKALRPEASDRSMMRAGRTFTYLYGVVITLMAVLIPYVGGAERVIVSILTLVISPLFIPSVWGLFSRRIGQRTVLVTMSVTFLVAVLVKSGLLFAEFAARRAEFVDAFVGLVFPVAMLLGAEIVLRGRGRDAGWDRYLSVQTPECELEARSDDELNRQAGRMYSRLALHLLIGTFAAIGLLMLGLHAAGMQSGQGNLLLCGVLFLVVSGTAALAMHLSDKRNKCNKQE